MVCMYMCMQAYANIYFVQYTGLRYRILGVSFLLELMVELVVVHSTSTPRTALHGTVKRIVIRSGTFIDSIQITYQLPNGQLSHGGHHGLGEGKIDTIDINIDGGERIVGILGKSGGFLNQLGFVTNMGRIFGPYGSWDGGAFTVNSCEIRGIFGRSGLVIDSIGFLCSRVD